LTIQISVGDFVIEIIRVIRMHITKYLKIKPEDLIKSQLGLGHSYSRMKCMYDVNREDKPIIQSIALIDQLDKNINSFVMRIKEWFSWHFPELAKIVSDNIVYVKAVNLIGKKDDLQDNEEMLKQLEEITIDPALAKQVQDATKTSMGSDLPEADLQNIKYFCGNVMNLIRYREELLVYLKEKMKKLAPNVAALIGETDAARLISHAGSLSNLAKYPASTIQILGAEKALFRALKTRGKTPKYGLLYHSSFIGKANQKNKGKVSRYLANKLAMCSRIDFFSEERYDDYGVELKNQIEERLKYLAMGQKPRKNIDVMKQVYEKLKAKEKEEKENNNEENGDLLKKKKKKAKKEEEEVEAVEEPAEGGRKKRKKKEAMVIQEEEQVEDEEEVLEKPKKKKKKSSA